MSVRKRPAFIEGSRLAVTAQSVKTRVDGGMNLRDVLDQLNAAEKAAVDWLADAVIAARGT